ncbi:MAG: hypothetical protein ABIR47_05830 [Candidatus Kapaibacterium sp.]
MAAGQNPQAPGNSAAAYPQYPQYAPPYYDPSYPNRYYSPQYSPNYSWYYPGDNYYYYPGRQNQNPQQNNGGVTDNSGSPTADNRESTVRRNPTASHTVDSADPFRADVRRDRPSSIGGNEPFSHKTEEKPKGDKPTTDRNPIVSGKDESNPRRATPVERTDDGRNDILHGHQDEKPTAVASDPRRQQPASTGASTPPATMQHHDLSGAMAESSKPAGVESGAHRDSAARHTVDESQKPQGAGAASEARRTVSPTTTAPVVKASDVKASEEHHSAAASQITTPIKNEMPAQSGKGLTEPKKETPAPAASAVRRDAGAVGVGTASTSTPVAPRNESGNAIDPTVTSGGVKND